jgi:hypothetical protein
VSTAYETALAAHAAGLCVLPPKEDGTKAPDADSWKHYQKTRSTRQEIDRWYANGRTGFGYLTGRVSGNVEVLDFEDRDIYRQFRAVANATGLGLVLDRIRDGCLEETPGGGVHLPYYCSNIASNAKLARRPKRPEEMQHEKDSIAVLIETRGEGGYLVAAPSNGRVHPSGGAYRQVRGGVGTIATITPEERVELLALARTFDQMPKAEAHDARTAAAGEGTPGDDYNARGAVLALLEQHGWVRVFDRNGQIYLRRPGKTMGTGATFRTVNGKRYFYVFTTSTIFEAEQAYSPFGVYAALEHGGDYKAAAKALGEQGYGAPRATATQSARAKPSPEPAVGVPPFPLDVLPGRVRAFVTSATSSIGCPPDFTAVSLLGLAEGVAGRSRRIVIRPGFDVSPGSWYGVVGEPGTGKSPGQKYALRAVTPLQDEAWERYRDRLDAWEALPKDERGEKPQPEHFFITDSTGEALWAALASSSGVAQVEDELRRRLKALDAYRQAGDRQAMLGLWANAPVKIVRRTSSPVYIPFPVAPLLGGIQPGVLRHLRGEGDDAEADDGWVPRFMLSWPEAEPLALSEVPFDAATLPPVVAIFRTLRLPHKEPHDTHLAGAAYNTFKAWHADNRGVQIESRGLERQWAAKAPIHLARLALVLHLFSCPEPDELLPVDTMEAAIELLEYFRGHLGRVLPAFGASATSGKKTRITRILRTAKQKDAHGWVRRTDIGEGLRNVSPEDLTAALEGLLASGVVEREVRPTTTKPVELWRLISDDSRNTASEDSGYSGFSPPEGEVAPSDSPARGDNRNNPNNRDDAPEHCGKPAICQALGPCSHLVANGYCWAAEPTGGER